MYRATTPIHSFHFEEDPQQYTKLLITYAQNNQIIMEKHEDDDSFVYETAQIDQDHTDYILSFKLTQEEANAFNSAYGSTVQVQVRAMIQDENTNEITAYASDIATFSVKDVLDDRILRPNEVR